MTIEQTLTALLSQAGQYLRTVKGKRRFLLLIVFLLQVVLIGKWFDLRTQLADKKSVVAELNQRLLDSQNRVNLSKQENGHTADQIRGNLSSRDELNGLILMIESKAPSFGLTLSDAGQSFVPATKSKLAHTVIQYSVQGSYAQVINFVSEAMNQYPSLVLRTLNFRRQDPMVSNPQISLEWALYYP